MYSISTKQAKLSSSGHASVGGTTKKKGQEVISVKGQQMPLRVLSVGGQQALGCWEADNLLFLDPSGAVSAHFGAPASGRTSSVPVSSLTVKR